MASLTVMSCSNEAKTIMISPRNSIFGIICIYIWGEQSYVDKFSIRVFWKADFQNWVNPVQLYSDNFHKSSVILVHGFGVIKMYSSALRFIFYSRLSSKGTQLFKKTLYLPGF